MKVCLVTHTFLPEYIGGREVHVFNLAKNLVAHGIETQVVTSGHSNSHAGDSALERMDVARIPVFSLPLARKPSTFSQRVLPTLPYVLMKSGADVIHAHDYYHLSSDMCAWTSKLTGKPLVLTIHSNLGFFSVNKPLAAVERTYNRTMGKVTLRQASKIIFVSRYAAREFLDKGMVTERQAEVIYPGLDVDEFDQALERLVAVNENLYVRKYGITEGPVLLCVGRIEKRKGLQYLIRTVPELVQRFPGLKVVIVGGDAGYLDHLNQLVAQLGIRQHVLFTGILSDEGDMEAMYFADVCVLPCEQDNFPETALRVAYLSTPIVASKVGGIPEFIVEGETGMLVEVGEKRGLCNSIERLLTDEEFSLKVCANARARVLQEHTMERITGRTLDLYNEALGC